MPYKDDDWSIFPTRTGMATGSANERQMLEAIGGAEGFRTRIQVSGDGKTQTILRTKNGMPQFETRVTEDEVASEEIILAGIELPTTYGDYFNGYPSIKPVGDTTKYVVFQGANFSLRKEQAKSTYYSTYSHSVRWVGTAGSVQHNGWENDSRDLLSSSGLLSAQYYLDTESPAWVQSLAAPGSLGIAGSWAQYTLHLPQAQTRNITYSAVQYGDGYPDAPGDIGSIRSDQATKRNIYAAFLRDDGTGGRDLLYIETPLSKCGWSNYDSWLRLGGALPFSQESQFGTLINITKNTSTPLVYPAIPAGGFLVGYSHPVIFQSFGAKPRWISVSPDGLTAYTYTEGGFYLFNDHGLDNYKTAGAIFEIDLVTGAMSLALLDTIYDRKYQTLSRPVGGAGDLNTYGVFGVGAQFDLRLMGFKANGDVVRLGAYSNSAVARSVTAFYENEQLLISVPVTHSLSCLVADVANELYIFEIAYADEHAVVVLYKRSVLATYAFTTTKSASVVTNIDVVSTNNALVGFSVVGPAFPTNGVFSQAVTKINMAVPSAHGPADRAGNQYDPPLIASASIDAKRKLVAISIMCSHRLDNNLVNIPVPVINEVITIATGQRMPFGAPFRYYNRIHFHE